MSEWNAVARPWQFPGFGISRETGIRILATVGFCLVTLVFLDALNDQFSRVIHNPTGLRIYLPFAATLAVALFFWRTRYQDFTSLLKACLRASALGLLVLLIVEAPQYSLANPQHMRAHDYVQLGYIGGLGCAVLGVFRPAFVIPTVAYIITTRHLVFPISGLWMSTLDIRYMLDMAMYLAIFGIFTVKIAPRIPRFSSWLSSTDRQMEIVGVACGLHLANYFWSGVAKLAAGPTPWYWISENHTHNQIPYTIESGILPIGHLPWLSQFAYDMLDLFHVPLNAIIVVVQLFAIVCILKVNWLKITSVLFDFLHIGIYVLGGLFFWPWIWNNLTIWWAARSSKQGLPINTKVAAVAAILIGAPAFNINPAAWLAWFDVADARQIRFEAVTVDGETVKVPSAFFLSHSYSVSHGYMGHHPIDGHYEGTMLASSTSVDRHKLDGQCVDPRTLKDETPAETPEQSAIRTEALQRFLAHHHDKMLEREAAVGRGSWYFHAHHHPSNPFLYDEFNNLPLDQVVGYNLVVESACHSMKDGQVQKKLLKRDTEYYNVR